MMDKIVFSTNWNNKLTCRYFTTLRLKDVRRFRYNERYEIHIRKGKESKFLCYASLVDMKHFKLDDINEFVAGLDTGYSAEEAKNIIRTMYKNSNIDWNTQLISLILLKKEDIKNQN